MCLTIPGKVLEVKEGKALVKSARETAQIDLGLVFGAKKGDWILYATNRAVKVISEQDAKEIIELLEDNYSPVNIDNLSLKFKKIIYKVRQQASKPASQQNSKDVISTPQSASRRMRAEKSHVSNAIGSLASLEPPTGGLGMGRDDTTLTKDEIIYLLKLKGKDNLETLYAEANFLRKDKIDDFVCIHGIIEFSNYCKNNCLYCGIRKDQNIQRYRMSKDEIVETAVNAVDNEGYKLLVLQSGEDSFYSEDDLLDIVKTIRKKAKVFVFLSVGERSAEFYKKAFKAGVSGSLIRFETSNENLYEKMRPDHLLRDRLESIKTQKKIGYYMASGSLIGLPEQSLEDIADDILMIKKLGVPMISAGPFLPVSNTPLENFQFSIFNFQSNSNDQITNGKINGKWKMKNDQLLELTLKYIAVCRFVMPEVKIPVTTALETLDPKNGRHKALLAGANALMFNLTPEKYCGKYKIYDNKYREREKVWQKYGLFKGEESYQMLEQRMNSLF